MKKYGKLAMFGAFLALGSGSVAHAQDNISFKYDDNEIREMSFTSNGKILLVKGGRDVVIDRKGIITSPSVQFWDVDGKRKLMHMAEKELGRASCVSPNGDMFAFRQQNDVAIFDVNERKTVSSIKFSENRNAFARPIAFTTDNKSLIIAQGSKSAIHTVVGGGFERELTLEGITQVLSADESYLVEVFVDSFRVTDFKNNKDKGILRCGKPGKQEEIKNVFFSPENRFLVTQSDNTVRMWDLLTMKQAYTFNVSPKENVFAVSNDGRFVAGGQDTLKLWEIAPNKTPKEIKTNLTFEGKITAVAFSPDADEVRYVAAGDVKGNIKLWRFTEENISKEYYASEINREMSAIKQKGEFETTDEYNKRKQKAKRAVYNKFLSYYTEHISSDNTLQEVALASVENFLEEKKKTIENSRQIIQFQIDSISAYNADKETFTVKITNKAENYNRTEVVRIPRRNNCAIDFKQNYKSLTITGVKQLKEDLQGFEIFNVKIKSNCEGNKEFEFGPQRLYVDISRQ